MSKYNWTINKNAELPHYRGGLLPLTLRILASRGIMERKQAEEFLHFDATLFSNPALMPDAEKAAKRLYRAILNGEKIVVYGDFDADGVTATAIMVQGLKKLGAKVSQYLPDRFAEGYGMNLKTAESLAAQGAKLIVTVDNGISSCNEVKRLNELGVDTIITDHHSIPDKLPPALAIVNPRMLQDNSFKDLTGAGVAYKFILYFFGYFGRAKEAEEYLPLAAIGTVADIMPLVRDNRYITEMGLRRLNEIPSPGLRELIKQAGLKEKQVTAERIAWVLAPRINAAGRLKHADLSYSLLTCSNASEAALLAAELESLNAKRQEITNQYIQMARMQTTDTSRILIFENESCPKGVIGLVAGKLCEEYWRPAIAINTEQELCVASCRSIEGFNITQALTACKDLLERFGGHEQAAGFSIKKEKLPAFKEAIEAYAKVNLDNKEKRPIIFIDALASLEEMSLAAFKEIKRLEPFGEGNPSPLFLSQDLQVLDWKLIGKGQEHISLKISQKEHMLEATAFNMAEKLVPLVQQRLDLVYNLEINEYNGKQTLRANIVDFKTTINT